MSIAFHSKIEYNIRQQRINAGLTQETAAELLGLSTLHYGRIERGTHAAFLDQLALIAELLNTSFEVLLSGSTNHLFSSDSQPKKALGILSIFLRSDAQKALNALCLTFANLLLSMINSTLDSMFAVVQTTAFFLFNSLWL